MGCLWRHKRLNWFIHQHIYQGVCLLFCLEVRFYRNRKSCPKMNVWNCLPIVVPTAGIRLPIQRLITIIMMTSTTIITSILIVHWVICTDMALFLVL